ncbi:uncharacterized protein [Apostichopus japonicus]|uniref:uncharacterized protein n=1 Tax=Stichopus japonicus TaxID=307972 RepID=UPI003AB6DD05
MADFPQFEPVISRNGRHKTQEELALPTNHDVTHSNHRMEKLEEKFKIIKDILLDIRIQDQTIIRLLLENYQKFLSSFEEQQWRSSLHIRHSSFPSSGTYQRLDTVRSILGQKGDLNIRQISQHLFPPGRRRRESEPIYFKGRLTSSLSFEETFEGIFSDDEETVVDPLSTSSFT